MKKRRKSEGVSWRDLSALGRLIPADQCWSTTSPPLEYSCLLEFDAERFAIRTAEWTEVLAAVERQSRREYLDAPIDVSMLSEHAVALLKRLQSPHVRFSRVYPYDELIAAFGELDAQGLIELDVIDGDVAFVLRRPYLDVALPRASMLRLAVGNN